MQFSRPRASLWLLAPFFGLMLMLSAEAQIRVTPDPNAPRVPPRTTGTVPVPLAPGPTVPVEAAGAGGLTTLERDVNINEAAYSAIVRIENEAWIPNYQTPWNAGGSGGGSGTGFLVGPNMFLTNAHVVSNSRLLYIKKVDDPKPYQAEIVHIAHDCDLALLRLIDSSAFDDVQPLQIGNVPPLNSTVIAVGYPIGGQRISVTRGVVSRIDFSAYAHSAVDWHLAVQVDAAINPGNSGGPVIQNGQVVGVAFQGYSGNVAQSTGYMIPSPVINRFLMDIQDGEYNYYPDLAISHFNILNPAQRKAMKLPNDGIGVMVSSADSAGSGGGLLDTGDIIVAIDGHHVSSDGYISMNGARVNMNEIVERKYVGDTVTLVVLRDGKPIELAVELKRFLPYLIQANQYDVKPQFVMFAGLVFQPVDRNLMAAQGITNLQVRYLYTYYSQNEIYEDKPQIVVVTQILPDEINTHLEPYLHMVVDEVNGKTIRTLKDLHKALFEDESEGDFHVIRLMGEGRPIVIEKSRVAAAQERIKEKYGVTAEQLLGDSLMGD